MSKVVTDSKHYTDIAEAIRGKGVEGSFKPSEMAAAIEEILSGGIIPSGSIILTEENTYDVTEKAQAVVDMSATRAALAEAVTAKGVDTLPDSSFDTIANHIGLIEGGGGLPNVRKFQVTTDASLGTYGGIAIPVVSSGRANYLIMNTDATHMTASDRYVRAIGVCIDYTASVIKQSVTIARYDMAGGTTLTNTLENGVLTILGSTVAHMEQAYDLDVYEIIW